MTAGLEQFGDLVFAVAPDYATGRLLVILDSGFDTAASAVTIDATIDRLGMSMPVEVVESCHPREALETVLTVMDSPEWHEQVAAMGSRFHAVRIDPIVGRVVVIIDAPDRVRTDLQSELRRTYGDLVEVVAGQDGGLLAGIRTDDRAPFYGGAAIRAALLQDPNLPPQHDCTANATVVVGGQRRMLTAGHCFLPWNGWLWQSLTHHIGLEGGRHASWPAWDIGLFTPSTDPTYGGSYTNRIYTGAQHQGFFRDVTFARNPILNPTEAHCFSGATSGTNCDFNAVAFNPSVMTSIGSVSNLYESWTTLVGNRCERGDSGGPAFIATSSGVATMTGLMVAAISAPEWGVRICYYHGAGDIQGVYGPYLTTP